MNEIAEPPRQLVLETVSVCNLRCPACHIGAQQTDRGKLGPAFMPWELFQKIADEAKAFVKHVYLHLWGEPTLHPALPGMIRTIKQFATIDLATHGMFVDESLADAIALCDTISVSIDGIGQEVYEKYRVRGDYTKAMAGMKRLAVRAPGRVNWTFILFKHNEHQVEEAKALAKDLGVNVGFKPPYLIDPRLQKEMLPTSEQHRRYNSDLTIKANPLNCREFWTTLYVLPSGDVITCCYDYNATMVMGNVLQSSLMEVWNGEIYQKARRTHLSGTLNTMCKNLCKLPC